MQVRFIARHFHYHATLRAALAVGLVAGGALAQEQGIVSYDEEHIEFWSTPPPGVYRDAPGIQSDSKAFLTREQVGHQWDDTSSLSVDAMVLLGGDGFGEAEIVRFSNAPVIGPIRSLKNHGHFLPGGTEFDVYLLGFDRISTITNTTAVEGDITFVEEIVALQYTTRALKGSGHSGGDDEFRVSGTTYPGDGDDPNENMSPHDYRGLENNAGDWLWLSADRKTLNFRLRVNERPDQLRVFTKPFEDTTFEEFCFGDGSEGNCPCARNAQDGSGTGCTNTSGEGARLQAFGTPTLEIVGGELRSDLELRITGMPANRFCVLFAGDGVESSAVLFGDGLRCVRPGPQGGIFTRSRVKNSGQNGGATWENAATSFGMANANVSVFSPGDQIGFQGYYRDPNPDNCTPGQGFNLTNAVGTTFVGLVSG